MNKPKTKSPANNDQAAKQNKKPTRQHPRLQTAVVGESKTKQSFAAESDINNIMARYKKTGEMPTINEQQPNYGFAPSYDFREAMEMVTNMTSNFEKLPAKIRQQFDFDPAEFLAFVEDPVNAAEAAEMGLIPPIDTPTPPAPGSDATEPQEAPKKEPSATTPLKAESDS